MAIKEATLFDGDLNWCVLDGGLLWLWGSNHSGQLGVENVDFISKPYLLSAAADQRYQYVINASFDIVNI